MKPEIAYICDGRACNDGCRLNSKECNHTTNIEHAKNFKRIHGLKYIEEHNESSMEHTSPEDFKEKMREASIHFDIETRHVKMDYLMCDLLIEFGYQDAVDIFRQANKWYA